MTADFENLLLGNKKLKDNDLDGAIYNFHLILKEKKKHTQLYFKNFDLLCKNTITEKNFELMKSVCEFYFEDNFVLHQFAFTKALLLTKFNKIKKNNNEKLHEINLEVINEKLFQLILKKCFIMDLSLEDYLTKLRRNVLKIYIEIENFQFLKKIYNFLIVFAEQCFLNEFIYFQSTEERDYLKKIEKRINNGKTICELDILLVSLYKPLNKLKYLKQKLEKYISNSKEFNDFLKYVFHDPNNDEVNSSLIKPMSNFSNKISKLMKKQYEENPYPRWRFTLRPIKGNYLKKISDKTGDCLSNENFYKAPQILIAGCGTGEQVVGWSAYKNAKITAIDLSNKSLAYSIRKSNELKLKNVNYYHLDLLDLDLLNKKFDVIVSTGCLHHMEKPEDGLRSLVNVLKPDGLLYLGLYSRRARSEINWTRNYIQRKKIKTTEKNMRAFREKMLKSSTEEFNFLKKSLDFFCLSNFRDLIFNYNEHSFDLIQIKKLLENNKLKFIRFTELQNDVVNMFKIKFPNVNDESRLESWDKFESKYPKTFFGMYKFWAKKIIK